MDAGGDLEVTGPDGSGVAAGIAMNFPALESSSPVRLPRRIRRRLMESRGGVPSTVAQIEAKLKEADLRRQQFHEWLSSKARPKPRSPSWSSQDEDLGHKLEAKLYAAEQKRLSLLAKAQLRLARKDELRQSVKTGVEKRFEREREQLSTKVKSRVQQAEENRNYLLRTRMQRQAAVQERKARIMLQKTSQENKYRECVRSAIFRKRAAAEKKRMVLLEAEKKRAHARVVQARQIARAICNQRESERKRLKEQLENRLLKAKRQRAEFLRQRKNPHNCTSINVNKHGDFLSRKLARCWRHFVRSRKTTFMLAKEYEFLKINENTVKSIPFEQLALAIESPSTIRTVNLLLDRLENRFRLSRASSTSSIPENIDHLLKHLASPSKRSSSTKTRNRIGTKNVSPREYRSSEVSKTSRYPARLLLCAYMILGHPNAVFSEQGEREVALAESAIKLVSEFELLVRIILDGPASSFSSRQSLRDILNDDLSQPDFSAQSESPRTFRNQLLIFDQSWCSYLYYFVIWKVKDARSLEEDLVRAACQLETSMMQTCKLTCDRKIVDLSDEMRAIQKQVAQDQQLLRDKVRHLSGEAGIERLESALSDTRFKFFEAKEIGSPTASHIMNPSPTKLLSSQCSKSSMERPSKSSCVVSSLFQSDSSLSESRPPSNFFAGAPLLPADNEFFVNEILHGGSFIASNSSTSQIDESGVQAKVQKTMERAFWDSVIDSLKEDEPDYGCLVRLVKEVRDELCEMSPKNWARDICESIDLVILSQIFDSGMQDFDYLGQILDYSLGILRKLSAPADEAEMKKSHEVLLDELAAIAKTNDSSKRNFIVAVVKGLRFVLDQIKVLKKEISKARILMMEPIINGPSGIEYLQKAFSDRYGPPSASSTLPRTERWIAMIKSNAEDEWNEHNMAFSELSASHNVLQVPALRAGGRVSRVSSEDLLASRLSLFISPPGDEQPPCTGEKLDIIVKLGLLKLTSAIEGLTADTLPETLELNLMRLRSIQSQYQQIIVVVTSMLVLRQVLVAERLSASLDDLENTISDCSKKLFELLDGSPDSGIEDLTNAIMSASSLEGFQARKEVVARMLVKSVQSEDPVFSKVAGAIYLAARGMVLGGNGSAGRGLAEKALRRVGAIFVADRMAKWVAALIMVAGVSIRVHGQWYRCFV